MNDTVSISKQEYQELLDFRQKWLDDRSKLARIELELQQLKKLMFGTKSERFISEQSSDQLNLFGERDTENPAEEPEEEISYKRKKKKKNKAKRIVELPSHLRREVEVIEPELNPAQTNFRKIGIEVTETLEYTPGDFYVRRIERPKYLIVKQNHQQEEADEKIVIAEMPTQVIPRGNAGASLLAFILVAKYVDHLPFYRQRMIFRRSEVDIAPSTIGGWMNQSCQLLEGLYHLLVDQMQQSSYLQADESPIKVQDKHKKGATHQGYMWVYHDPVCKNVVFQYDPSRSQRVPANFFVGMDAMVQTDGYKAYNVLEKHQNKSITLMACMAHARRKFDQALDNDQATAEKALHYFQHLYTIEQEAREQNLSYDQRKQLRHEKAQPILDQFHLWLQEVKGGLLPKSKIAIAVNYTLDLWNRLQKYTQDGRYEIDNNFVENTIRPLALGRKNYLFAGSHDAAQRAAMIYSLFASCKANGLNPYKWLKEVLQVISDHKVNKLYELLPSSTRFKQ